MTTRSKTIGRGDEASGPVIDARASASMARGESINRPRKHGTPKIGKYSRRLGGEYGSAVSHLQ